MTVKCEKHKPLWKFFVVNLLLLIATFIKLSRSVICCFIYDMSISRVVDVGLKVLLICFLIVWTILEFKKKLNKPAGFLAFCLAYSITNAMWFIIDLSYSDLLNIILNIVLVVFSQLPFVFVLLLDMTRIKAFKILSFIFLILYAVVITIYSLLSLYYVIDAIEAYIPNGIQYLINGILSIVGEWVILSAVILMTIFVGTVYRFKPVKVKVVAPKPAPAPVVQALSDNSVEQIKKYKELLDSGIISQAEFESKRQELINM